MKKNKRDYIIILFFVEMFSVPSIYNLKPEFNSYLTAFRTFIFFIHSPQFKFESL